MAGLGGKRLRKRDGQVGPVNKLVHLQFPLNMIKLLDPLKFAGLPDHVYFY